MNVETMLMNLTACQHDNCIYGCFNNRAIFIAHFACAFLVRRLAAALNHLFTDDWPKHIAYAHVR